MNPLALALAAPPPTPSPVYAPPSPSSEPQSASPRRRPSHSRSPSPGTPSPGRSATHQAPQKWTHANVLNVGGRRGRGGGIATLRAESWHGVHARPGAIRVRGVAASIAAPAVLPLAAPSPCHPSRSAPLPPRKTTASRPTPPPSATSPTPLAAACTMGGESASPCGPRALQLTGTATTDRWSSARWGP